MKSLIIRVIASSILGAGIAYFIAHLSDGDVYKAVIMSAGVITTAIMFRE